MTAAVERCHLLDLPVELRMQIYDYLIYPKTIHLWVDWNVYRWRAYVPVGAVALLASCKTIHGETRPIFYDRTTVHFLIHDEFERPLSRYRRFSSLEDLNANAFKHVSKVRMSLHTLTEPIFHRLIKHMNGWLSRMNNCSDAKALEIHFEFWSTISNDDLCMIYDVLCAIEFSSEVEIGTRATGDWIRLYNAPTFRECLLQARSDIFARRQGRPLMMQNKHIIASIGPRDLILRSVGDLTRSRSCEAGYRCS